MSHCGMWAKVYCPALSMAPLSQALLPAGWVPHENPPTSQCTGAYKHPPPLPNIDLPALTLLTHQPPSAEAQQFPPHSPVADPSTLPPTETLDALPDACYMSHMLRRLVHVERGKHATRELNRCVNHT